MKAFKEEQEIKPDEAEEHPRVQKFKVTNPTLVNKSMKYTVEGEDDAGEFIVIRRYREFDAFVQALKSRWLGCYLP